MLYRFVSAKTIAACVPALILLTTLSAAHTQPIRVKHHTRTLTTKKPRPVTPTPSRPAHGQTAVIGANAPEQIPDDVVASLFLRVTARGAALNNAGRLDGYLNHVGVPPAARPAIISLATNYEHGVRNLDDRAAIKRGLSGRLSPADSTALNQEKAELIAGSRSALIKAVGSAEKWSQILDDIKHKTTVVTGRRHNETE